MYNITVLVTFIRVIKFERPFWQAESPCDIEQKIRTDTRRSSVANLPADTEHSREGPALVICWPVQGMQT